MTADGLREREPLRKNRREVEDVFVEGPHGDELDGPSQDNHPTCRMLDHGSTEEGHRQAGTCAPGI